MQDEEASLFDKYYNNLTEAGKLARRLSWLIVIVVVFFSYLSISFPSQPQQFKIGLLGELTIPKGTLMLVGPFLIAILYLSWVLMYIYSVSVHAHLNALLDKKDAGLLKYPSFETLLSTLAREHVRRGFVGRLFVLFAWVYKIGIHGLPVIGHLYLTWRALQFTSANIFRGCLVASFLPLLFGLLVALPDAAKLSGMFTQLTEGTTVSHLKRYWIVDGLLFLIVATSMFTFGNRRAIWAHPGL